MSILSEFGDKHGCGPLTASPDAIAWSRRNTLSMDAFPIREVARSKAELGVQVSLVLPTRNVGQTIKVVLSEVEALRRLKTPLLDQVLVVDGASTDGTRDIAASSSAELWTESELVPSFGPALGKGDAMWRSLWRVRGDLVVFADSDTIGFTSSLVTGILGPLIRQPDLRFVKAAFRRPFLSQGHKSAAGGGRVTELTARPLLNLFFPELTGFVQPLAGEFGCWRSELEAIPFITGYGVESGLLIDLLGLVGLPAMAQIDVGERQNRHQSLHDLSRMSFAVARTIISRAARWSRLVGDPDALLGPALGARYVQASAAGDGVILEQHLERLVERPPVRSVRG